jgi:protoporphyrinogen oxidase
VTGLRERDGMWLVEGPYGVKTFDIIVSTIPIFSLCKAIGDLPSQVSESLWGLRYNSLICVMIGLKTDRLPAYTAVYFPNKEFKPNRVAFPKVFSPDNVPQGKCSLVVEITANEGDGTWELSDSAVLDDVISGLEAIGIMSRYEISYSKVMRSKYAYVVYSLNYLKDISTVRKYLDDMGIISCGRFAEFEYLNMDACVERAIAAAKKLDEK